MTEERRINVEQCSVTELKALAYDEISKVEQAQANIKAINEQIARKLKNAQTQEVTDSDGSEQGET